MTITADPDDPIEAFDRKFPNGDTWLADGLTAGQIRHQQIEAEQFVRLEQDMIDRAECNNIT